MNSCIKLTESKGATPVPLRNSSSIKGAHGLPGEVLGIKVTETQQNTAQSLSLPLLAFLLPVMHLGAMWVPGRCGTGTWTTCDVSDCSLVQAWRWTGVSLTGLQLYSPKQNQHLSLYSFRLICWPPVTLGCPTTHHQSFPGWWVPSITNLNVCLFIVLLTHHLWTQNLDLFPKIAQIKP